mmetsp:Transcript_26972/g.58960  ORF Transcript_26972/g.58960 Transcript_26972/m.58960 type:complete len:445 (+) Transcript_26972:1164-2498(+)
MAPACSAARGTSIMVPTLYFRAPSRPAALSTWPATLRTRASWFWSSAGVPTSGTMISGLTTPPLFATLTAASKMACTCISVISGYVMPRRQPLKPSIGFTSDSLSMVSYTSSTLMPASWARAAQTSSISPSGRNSCRGGSSSRMVTGRPSMALKMPSKSALWKGSRSARALRRASLLCATIILLTAAMRSSLAKNMCSVRHRPMPSAPNFLASAASSGVSALVSTLSLRLSSTHFIKAPRSPASLGGDRGCLPRMISPVLPLRDMKSPSRISAPLMRATLLCSSTCRSCTPVMQGLPQPRATTAAWLVMPPSWHSTPSLLYMPFTSSGDVSLRTSTTLMPAPFHASACSAEKTAWPTAAPGEAGRPVPSTWGWYAASSANWGCSSWSRWPGSTMVMALLMSTRPSSTRSTAILTAAAPVRLPPRHCSMNSLPSCTVNSMSCMSL